MRHCSESREASAVHDADRGGSTPLMALALFAGVVVGATLAQSWYREHQARRHRAEKHERIERWEGEGGALPGTVGTGAAGNASPAR